MSGVQSSSMLRQSSRQQQPSQEQQGNKRSRRGLASSSLLVNSRSGWCRRGSCGSTELIGDRLRRALRRSLLQDADLAVGTSSSSSEYYDILSLGHSPEEEEQDRRRHRSLLLSTFNSEFEKCLCAPTESGVVLAAFSGPDLRASVVCQEPLPTASALTARQAESIELSKRKQASDKAKFVKEFDAETDRLKAAMEAHDLKKKEFEFEQKVKQEKHKTVTEAYFAEQFERIKNSCVIPKNDQDAELSASCRGINIPDGLLSITDANAVTAKFRFHQKFAYDPALGECVSSRPGYDDVLFHVRYAEGQEDDGTTPKWKCDKDQKKKCGEDKKYESKMCYWNGERMVAEVEVAVRVTDLGAGDASTRRNLLLRHDERRNLEDEECVDARTDPEFCVLEYLLDCNCAFTTQ